MIRPRGSAKRRPSALLDIALVSPLFLTVQAGCNKPPQETSSTPEYLDPVEADAVWYPDRASPYDAYEKDARVRMHLELRNPAALERELRRLASAYRPQTSYDLAAGVRELFYGWGIPSGMLDAADPSGVWAMSFEYPIRRYTGEIWARVPTKDAGKMADEVETWLTMDEVEPGLWRSAPDEVIDGPETDPDHTAEGVYVRKQADALQFAIRKNMLDRAVPNAGNETETAAHDFWLEVEGFPTAIPDILVDFDETPHAEQRDTWRERLERLDRLWVALDVAEERDLKFSVGFEGRLDGWDEGLLGPMKTGPSTLAGLLPADPFVAATMSWGDPSTVSGLLANFQPGAEATPLEREALEVGARVLDRIVEDFAFAVYVDERGRHTFVLAAHVDDVETVRRATERSLEFAERAIVAKDAELTARVAAGEVSEEDAKGRRYSTRRVKYKMGKAKVDVIELQVGADDTLVDGFLRRDDDRVPFTTFVRDDALFLALGPGLEGVVAAMGKSGAPGKSLADTPAYKATYADGGCRVCGVYDGGQAARSMYGRVVRDLSAEQRSEASSVLPQLAEGYDAYWRLHSGPKKARLDYVIPAAGRRGDEARAKAWDAFLKALGQREEGVTDPREWLFG